ncbi:MAG: hypothetical protein ACOH2J_05820 [Allorhizobium sp.]
MRSAVDFVFKGQIECDSFLEFAAHRAARLDLDFDIGAFDTAAVAISVAGPDDLVDAFEMACSLGPYDCIVLDVMRTETSANGRTRI